MSEEVRVDPAKIEKQLSEMLRRKQEESGKTVIKAALWNVVAHTWTDEQRARAADVLSRASEAVPQRTIVVQSNLEGKAEISSFISPNCHLVSGDRQVCSEEIAILASGDHVEHVPPLVSALLLPDMPVAVWWMGDLPRDLHYAEVLLDPAERLIFDSAQFDSRDDLEFIRGIAQQTTTAPADLNWARIEEWRAATAALFDPPQMRERLQAIRGLRIFNGGTAGFGADAEALLYVSWMTAQTGKRPQHEIAREGNEDGINGIEIQFDDGSLARMRGDRSRGVVICTTDGTQFSVDAVTRSNMRGEDALIVRLLKRPEADRIYLQALNIALQIAA